jgi:hypothetical protein
MKRYYLLGGSACDIYSDYGIEALKAEALKTDITSFGDVICNFWFCISHFLLALSYQLLLYLIL